MTTLARWVICSLLLLLYMTFIYWSVWQREEFGFVLFLVSPVVFGFVAGMAMPTTRADGGANNVIEVQAGVIAMLLVAALLLLMLGVEGLLCIIMASPIVLITGMFGGLIAYYFRVKSVSPSSSIMMALLSVGSLLVLTGVEPLVRPEPPLTPVITTMEINAPPAVVWKNLVSFDTLPAPTEWYFRAGIAAPLRARIEGNGVGAVRYCEFTTGPFVEPITVWDAPRRLAFDVVENPPAMRELSPYPHLHTAHLDGVFESRRGEFLLTALPDGRTLRQGTTWYEHDLWPNIYWRWWTDALIHRIHLRVLKHIKDLSETPFD